MKQSDKVLAEVNGILGQALSDRDSIITGQDHQIETLQLELSAAKKMISIGASEMEGSRELISSLTTTRNSLEQEVFNLKAINEIQTNRLTELSVKVDEAMKFTDQVRIVLFDVVDKYKELEATNDARRTD
jgi:hypothetical protein